MKPKTITIVSIIITVIGIFIAGFGIGMNVRGGQQGSGTVVTWVGLAIIFLFSIGGGLLAASRAKKSKNE